MFCTQCGTAVPQPAKFCPACGTAVAGNDVPSHATTDAPPAVVTAGPFLTSRQETLWIRAGLVAVGFFVITTTIFALGSLKSQGVQFSPSALLDAAMFAALGYGLYRRSRACAAGLIALYLAERVWVYSESQSVKLAFGGLWPTIFVFVLGGALIATISHHRRSSQPTP